MTEGVNSSMIYMIYYKNFCKCHNVPPPSILKKEVLKKHDSVISCLKEIYLMEKANAQ
jgi:hypothetical protein